MAKILLVDDEENIRLVVKRTLERSGYEVMAAADGLAGYQMAVRELPELVLLDITMPGMGGFMVLHKLKSNPATGHIPVIILTSSLHSRDEQVAREEGAIDYILKPWDRGVLEARVRNALGYCQTREKGFLEALAKEFIGDYFAIPKSEMEHRIALNLSEINQQHKALGQRTYDLAGSARVELEHPTKHVLDDQSFRLYLALAGDGTVRLRQGVVKKSAVVTKT